MGATIHDTLHNQRIHNLVKCTDSDSVAVENGERINSIAICELKGNVNIKNRNVVSKVVLKDIAYTPQSKFNLLSVTRMISEG